MMNACGVRLALVVRPEEDDNGSFGLLSGAETSDTESFYLLFGSL